MQNTPRSHTPHNSRRRQILGAGLGLGLSAIALGSARANPAVKGDLVLYTSQLLQDAQQTVAAFEQAHPNVKVRWVRDGTTQLLTKLRAEFSAGAPQPDVLLIADALAMAGLKREGRLQPYKDAAFDGFPASLREAGGYWYGTKLITTGLAWNTAAKMTPKRWWDLQKPEALGQIDMPSPLYSGAAMVMAEAFTQHPDLGWAYYDMLARQKTIAQGGNGGVFKNVSSGAKLYAVLVDFLAIRAAQKGAPIRFVFPEEGVSAVTEPVAVLQTARNVEAARAFVDFTLSAPGQELVSKQGMMPARAGITPPPGFPNLGSFKLLNVDADRALDALETDKKRFSNLFA
ncbi:MAG: ABC transporter substrate-binding protein [Burkholderiaceae bacterium]|nr:ABC transporter substrate-binding protein [Burkholderiaceae bacterium]